MDSLCSLSHYLVIRSSSHPWRDHFAWKLDRANDKFKSVVFCWFGEERTLGILWY